MAANKLTVTMSENLIIPKSGQGDALAKHPESCQPSPKWAAVVNDALVLLPQRRATARLIKHEAGVAADLVLVRDHGSPNDVPF